MNGKMIRHKTKPITSERVLQILLRFCYNLILTNNKISCCLILIWEISTDLKKYLPSTWTVLEGCCGFPPYLGVGLPQWGIECLAYGGVVEGKFGREFFGEVSCQKMGSRIFFRVWRNHSHRHTPIGSMYGICLHIYTLSYIYHSCIGKYTIHGSYGIRRIIYFGVLPATGWNWRVSKDPLPQLE